MIKQLGFLFDMNRCIGCRSCEEACRNEHYAKGSVGMRKVKEVEPGIYLSLSCNHCDSPECFRVCPSRAYTKRKDGIVLINPNLCTGCGNCIRACPYDAPRYDAETNKVDKCDMCLHRLQKGLLPACVTACHAGSIRLIDLEKNDRRSYLTKVNGFPDIRLTRPSTRFLPFKARKRYWQEK